MLAFPSRTDTFGLVMLEAVASGLPIAAFPVAGPMDVVGDAPEVGALDERLDLAIAAALRLRREDCAAFARGHGWEACTAAFLAGLAPAEPERLAA